MEELRARCEQALASGEIEENGTLGQAMGYVLHRFEALTLFCTFSAVRAKIS